MISRRLGAWALRGGLLAVGCWLTRGNSPPAWGLASYLIPAIALGLLLIPRVRAIVRRGCAWIDRLPRARIFVAIWLVATVYLYFTAARQHRVFLPLWHDENSYLVLARQLSIGRLWMPAPPAPDSFDTTYVIVRPVYASIYFVGAGLFYVLPTLAHLPAWTMSLAVAGILPAMLFLVLAEFTDQTTAIAGAVLLLVPPTFRMNSIRILAQLPVMLLYLSAVWAWLRWRVNPNWRWMLLIGILAGWAAITRPLDAVIGFVPIGLAVLWQLRTTSWRRGTAMLTVACVAATPFLLLQLVSNRGITGSWLQTPWSMYCQRDYPNSGIGFHKVDLDARPASVVPQKQRLYTHWLLPMLEKHRPDQIWHAFDWERRYSIAWGIMPHPWLFALVPLGFVGLRDVRSRVLLVFLPLFVIAYTFYYWLPLHYILLLLPAGITALLLAVRDLTGRWSWMVMLALVAMCICRLPEFTGSPDELLHSYAEVPEIEAKMKQVTAPAVVFFKYTDAMDAHVEPVYQLDWPTPQDAPIARAHDLGAVYNVTLLAYYLQNDPNRSVWHYDRAAGTLRRLGTVTEVMNQLPEQLFGGEDRPVGAGEPIAPVTAR